MNDQQLEASVRQFLARHYSGIGDELEDIVATSIPEGYFIEVQLAAGMIQISVVVDAGGMVRLAREVKMDVGCPACE